MSRVPYPGSQLPRQTQSQAAPMCGPPSKFMALLSRWETHQGGDSRSGRWEVPAALAPAPTWARLSHSVGWGPSLRRAALSVPPEVILMPSQCPQDVWANPWSSFFLLAFFLCVKVIHPRGFKKVSENTQRLKEERIPKITELTL